MYVIMGATGNIGGAAAKDLLERGEDVAVLTRNAAGADAWARDGADVREADAADAASLRAAFGTGARILVVNPPADPSTDVDTVERATASSILAALEDARAEKVVAVSTYGARQDPHLADLGVLWDLERGLDSLDVPVAVNRGAYYMTNWDGMLDDARRTGVLSTMLPRDLTIPMVDPIDLGLVASRRLRSGRDDVGVEFVEGPARYTVDDVAEAMGRALDRAITVEVAPRDAWREIFRSIGFSEASAESFARMNEATADGGFDLPDDPIRGGITLDEHFARAAGS